MKSLWDVELTVCLRKQFLQWIPAAKLNTILFLSFSSTFQGGAEHNVPVVISKIFKDQIGKKVFYVIIL